MSTFYCMRTRINCKSWLLCDLCSLFIHATTWSTFSLSQNSFLMQFHNYRKAKTSEVRWKLCLAVIEKDCLRYKVHIIKIGTILDHRFCFSLAQTHTLGTVDLGLLNYQGGGTREWKMKTCLEAYSVTGDLENEEIHGRGENKK